MCIKVDQDEALRAANRPRVEGPPDGAGLEWSFVRMQETLLLTQRLEDVARASGDWSWETDARHRYTWVHGIVPGMRLPAIGDPIPAGRVVNWLGEPESPPRDLHDVLRLGEPIVRLVTEEQHQRQTRYVSRCAVALLNADGSLRGYRGSARDVTQSLEAKIALWRRDEALRRAKEQAEASSQAKSVLVSKVGHELRTPLNAIVGLAQLIQTRSAPGDTVTLERRIAQIAETGWHMVDVLDVLLELGRAGAVNASLERQPVDIAAVIREAIRIVEHDAHARRIRIVLRGQASMPTVAHRAAIRQVVVNLLSNAIKYNRERGSVWVTLSQGESTQIEIRDTGAGLTGEQIGRLFRPFERVGAEASAVAGHGLGLAICQELLSSMEGTIAVRSQPGQGTAFTVTLRPTDKA
jgi:signal transduction histidine kinase